LHDLLLPALSIGSKLYLPGLHSKKGVFAPSWLLSGRLAVAGEELGVHGHGLDAARDDTANAGDEFVSFSSRSGIRSTAG